MPRLTTEVPLDPHQVNDAILEYLFRRGITIKKGTQLRFTFQQNQREATILDTVYATIEIGNDVQTP